MKVWVIITDYFDGEGSANGTGCVFSSKKKAEEYCDRKNAARFSAYSTSYAYEERTVDSEVVEI